MSQRGEDECKLKNSSAITRMLETGVQWSNGNGETTPTQNIPRLYTSREIRGLDPCPIPNYPEPESIP